MAMELHSWNSPGGHGECWCVKGEARAPVSLLAALVLSVQLVFVVAILFFSFTR